MMLRLNGFLQKQMHALLENKQYAFVCALALAFFPYTAWLSIVIIALITLRKGWREGALVLLPVITAHLGCSLMTVSKVAAVINTLTLFVPCYLAACTLRVTANWQGVAGVFFLLTSLSALLVQLFAPEFVMAQYVYLQAILKEAQSEAIVSNLLNDTTGLNRTILASYAFGIQMVSVVFSAMTSLMMARSMQSRLFNPGGFKQEILAFRVNKIGLLIAVMLFAATIQHNVVAMIILPALILYFLLAGLSVSANALIKKNPRLVFILLVMPLIIVPFIMVPVYGILGLIDSLFNLRIYTFKPKRRG
ncbi:MAG: hypothetical protein Q8R83_02530 [Legionellaceae bacterium]|nr:hypothetical protein [Legionellaceae bacterium]